MRPFFLLTIFAFSFISCDDSALTIPVNINAEIAFSVSTAIEDYANEYNVIFPNPYPNDERFPPVHILQSVDIFRSLNLDKKDELKKNKDNIDSIFIDSLKFSVKKNDLTHPIHEIKIWLAERSYNESTEKYFAPTDKTKYKLLGRLKSIKPGETVTHYLYASFEGEEQLEALLPQMGMAIWVEAIVEFDSEFETPLGIGYLPGGGIEANLEMNLTVLAMTKDVI